MTAAVVAMLLEGCASGTVKSSTAKTGPTGRSGHASTRPHGPPTSSATPAAESVLDCSAAAVVDEVAPLQVVLGVVALPISPRYPALQTSLSGHGQGALRLFAKNWSLLQAGRHVRAHYPRRAHQPAQHRVGHAQPSGRGPQLRQPRRRRMAGPRGRVLDRSPGLRAHHRQSRRQTAAGAHRRRKGVPWPATAARTESELATTRRPITKGLMALPGKSRR